MKHVDKSQASRAEAFNRLVDGCIAQGRKHYKDLLDDERNALRAFLRNEQVFYCAYCMQRVEEGTVEHVIPQGISESEFGVALHQAPPQSPFYPPFVHQKRFDPHLSPRSYYPHTLAYGNVVCACKSCNQKKGADIIVPTFFLHEPGLRYSSTNGKVTFPKGALSSELRVYLNENMFCLYRLLWCLAVDDGLRHQQMAVMKKGERKRYLMAKRAQLPVWLARYLDDKSTWLIGDVGWTDFLCYQWFADYYLSLLSSTSSE